MNPELFSQLRKKGHLLIYKTNFYIDGRILRIVQKDGRLFEQWFATLEGCEKYFLQVAEDELIALKEKIEILQSEYETLSGDNGLVKVCRE